MIVIGMILYVAALFLAVIVGEWLRKYVRRHLR